MSYAKRQDALGWLLSPFFCLLFASAGLCESEGEGAEDAIALEEIVVTASRTDQTLRDLPAHVTVLTRADIRRSAAQSVDDFLRQVPGFSLFRRSSSLVAHPTTQGVSLRGIGASGASRTLVLLDGMPLNDPFGGWVQWGKVRMGEIERVEVLRGGGSHLWGNYALGGVIQVVTDRPRKRGLMVSGEGGTGRTGALDVGFSDRIGATGLALSGSYFDTQGYPVVRVDQRGTIDGKAASENRAVRLKLTHDFSSNASLFIQSGAFKEDRDNGTPLTRNSTKAGYAGVDLAVQTAGGSKWRLSGFWHLQRFKSFFSAQAADRNSERPALDQFRVPSSAVGVSLSWLKPVNASHLLTAGADFRWLSGETNEAFFFSNGAFIRRRQAGGDQQVLGFYFQDIFIPRPRWQITVGGRVDFWRSFDAFRQERDLTSGRVLRDDAFAERSRWAFNPRVGLRYHANDRVSLRGSFYRTFRAPTLNELFRPFRVWNVITAANEGLDSERLLGGEGGVDYAAGPLSVRLTGYWNEVKGSVVNLTLASGPGNIDPCGFVPNGGLCRQRRNLDRIQLRGIEAELVYHSPRLWNGSISYLYNDTEIVRAPTLNLTGKRVPQVPVHRLVLKLGYTHPSLLDLSIQWRYVGNQFEDDANTLVLGDFGVVNLLASRQIAPGKEVFFQVENVLDATYAVGKSGNGIETIGAPVRIHGGVRMQF